MKTAIIFLLLSICFLPLAISARPPFIRLPSEAEYPPVLDIDGNPVVVGAIYYANVSTGYGVVGGISVANFNDPSACPTDVFVNLSILPNPPPLIRPIIFYPFGDPTEPVREKVPLNVAFYEPDPYDPCANETVWKLDDQNMVMTGGVIGDPDSWFIIEHSNLTFRPNSYIFWRISIVDKLNRLGITDKIPYPFKFVKAGD